MEIIEVSKDTYGEIIRIPYFIYGSADFNDLNKSKCEELYYLLFKEGKYRLGIIGGSKDGIFCSPISAPFGAFSFVSEDVKLQYIEEAIKILKQWVVRKGMKAIILTLPPSIYCESFFAKQLNSLWRSEFEVLYIDLNYFFPLNVFDNNFNEHIWHNARKNLRIALNCGLEFQQCNTEEGKKLAYEIIRKNREERNYPLKLSWDQIKSTSELVVADFFLINIREGISIASAIVFHVSSDVVQVIYWGDISGYSEVKPMNFLSYKVFEHYGKSGKKIVDIGPSTEHSIPNYGLCEFKESIGCKIGPKYSLINSLL